jgi:GTP-binding protein
LESRFKKSEFLKSSGKVSQCPEGPFKEVAFIGRSNVGKSSLINALTNNKNLAKTSSKPGKTQHINHFVINDEWHLVDLPGYGYAKVPKNLKDSFKGMISNYLLNREQLQCIFVLLDSRHKLQKIDNVFIEWLGENGVPFCLVYTKLDKLKRNEKVANVKRIEAELLETWEFLPATFPTSAEKKEGLKELEDFIFEKCL